MFSVPVGAPNGGVGTAGAPETPAVLLQLSTASGQPHSTAPRTLLTSGFSTFLMVMVIVFTSSTGSGAHREHGAAGEGAAIGAPASDTARPAGDEHVEKERQPPVTSTPVPCARFHRGHQTFLAKLLCGVKGCH